VTLEPIAPHAPTPTDLVFHPSWPADAQALLRRAIDRHGGWSLWQRLQAVSLGLTSLRGFLPWLKGYRRTFDLEPFLTTFPKAVRTEWRPRPHAPATAVFDRGDMRLCDPAGQPLQESRDHRRKLHKLLRWSPPDAHYFFGYAFASYTAVPFILPALPYLRPVAARWRGQRLLGVRVRFPAEAQVHSVVQDYLFDAAGLLRRNDYVADVVGPCAVGAHVWDDFVTLAGLPLPARRTVYARLGRRAVPFLIALDATFAGFEVRLG
jgi:hypothetical protein